MAVMLVSSHRWTGAPSQAMGRWWGVRIRAIKCTFHFRIWFECFYLKQLINVEIAKLTKNLLKTWEWESGNQSWKSGPETWLWPPAVRLDWDPCCEMWLGIKTPHIHIHRRHKQEFESGLSNTLYFRYFWHLFGGILSRNKSPASFL